MYVEKCNISEKRRGPLSDRVQEQPLNEGRGASIPTRGGFAHENATTLGFFYTSGMWKIRNREGRRKDIAAPQQRSERERERAAKRPEKKPSRNKTQNTEYVTAVGGGGEENVVGVLHTQQHAFSFPHHRRTLIKLWTRQHGKQKTVDIHT